MTTNETRENRTNHVITSVALLLAMALIGVIIWAVASMPPKPGSYADSNVEEVLVLDGTWESKSDPSFKALIKNGTIEVNIISDNTASLYWKGTFEWTPGKESIVSIADKAALDGSLLGSLADDKTFLYKGDNLIFDVGMLGTTTTITMEKI